MTTERIDIVVREDGSRVVKRNLQDIGGAADDAASSLDMMKNILTGLIAGGIITGLVRMADAYTNIQNKLRLVTTGTENLARVTKELQGIANDTRSDFEATSELYARLANSSKELGIGQKQLLSFTKTLNQAIVLSGASAEEAAGGIRQLAQGMASGTLRGDELNSVMENFPKVADIIAQGLGVTRGELRKLGAEGKITAKDIIDAFAQAEKAVNEDFGKTIPTVSQSLTVFRNNFMIWVGQMDQATGITANLSKLILFMSQNLDTLIPILLGVGAAIATAFAPGIIMQFAAQIRGLWALMLANPFVAVAAIITGLITTLYLMRDQIKLGIDDTTTLGDLMRAAWEDVGPAITAVMDLAAQFFAWLTNTSSGTFDQLLNDIVGYEHASESTWFKILRVVVQVFDMIGGTIRGVMAGVNAVIAGFINAWINNFKQLGNAIDGIKELDPDKIKAAITSNLDGYKEAATGAGDAFSAAFQAEILSQADSGLESYLNKWTERAKEIGKARAAAEGNAGDLAGASGKPPAPPVDADAAKKAARELERLKNALASVLDAANPVDAATRRLAEAQDILNRAVKAGLINQDDAAKAYANLADMMRDQLDPLAAINRHLDENIGLLKLSNDQRQIEADMMNFTEQLRRDGVKMTQQEVEALRAKLVVEQELSRIAQARDSLQGNSMAEQMKEFTASIEAMKQLMADTASGFGQGDVAGGLSSLLPWANLEGTQEQMDAYVALHAQMYEQIRQLEDASIINSQTAGMLRNQADLQLLEQRLSNTRKFFGALAQLSSSENKKLAQIGKAAAIVQATIDGVLAVQKTMAETPYPYNIPLAAAQAALAAANVAQIASTGFRTGGSMTVGGSGGPDSQLVAFRATPGEKINVNTPSQDAAIRNGAGQSPEVNVPVTIVNVDDPQRAVDAMDTAAGKSVIMNHMQSDPAAFKRALGMA